MKVVLASLLLTGCLASLPSVLLAQALPPGPTGPASAKEKQKAAAVERAKRFLAKKLGLEAAKLSLASAEAQTWPDASLGCPDKDRMYAQVVTSGFRVVLHTSAKSYDVHVAGDTAVLCETGPSSPK